MSTRTTVVAGVAAAAVAVGGWLLRPDPPEFGPPTGDETLRSRVTEHYSGPGHRLAVAVVSGDSVKFAGYGADEHSSFEIGSISKGLTGLLLADAVRRGEVKLDQQVGSLLPLEGAEVASATLEELASHRSGLPRLATGPTVAARSLLAQLSAGNPYPYDVDGLLDQARAAGTDGRGEATYSNLGAAVLGQALARKAGMSYQDLLAERIFGPLGMRESKTPLTAADAAPAGFSAGGRKQTPWVQDGYAPTGGVVSTPGDMALLAKALLGGTSVTALAPRHDYRDDGDRIGLFWLTSPLEGTGRKHVWHNGGTGGYRSFIGLDLEKKRAVIVLSDVGVSVDDLGAELLAEDES